MAEKKKSKQNIIFLSGKKGTGKTTVADYVVEKYGFHKLGFKDPIVDVCAELFNLPRYYFIDRELKKSIVEPIGKSPREIMQMFGTEVGRLIWQDMWVNLFDKRYKSLKEGVGDELHLVCDDCRFPNELEYGLSIGAQIWRVHIKDSIFLYMQRCFEPDKEHESETALDRYGEWDAILTAEKGDIESLYRQTDKLMKGGAYRIKK